MAEKESHAIRNGTIAGVLAALISAFAIPACRVITFKVLHWLHKWILSGWKFVVTTHSVRGWAILLVGTLGLIGLIAVIQLLWPEKLPEYSLFKRMTYHGAIWRWQWLGNTVVNLWGFCPHCDASLVFDDSSMRDPFNNRKGTEFICEHCQNAVIARIDGGGKDYAIALITREIERQVRTGEYKAKLTLA